MPRRLHWGEAEMLFHAWLRSSLLTLTMNCFTCARLLLLNLSFLRKLRKKLIRIQKRYFFVLDVVEIL